MDKTSVKKKVKCLIWDLDNTLWDGVLLEGPVTLKAGIVDVLKTLDLRGILVSIASHNEAEHALKQVAAFGLEKYFLYPQVGWQPKSEMVKAIAEALNIGIDSLAFIDDQLFQREEVSYTYPEVLGLDGNGDISGLVGLDALNPPSATPEQSQRRLMYKENETRQQAESNHRGPPEEFLNTLNMVLKIDPADADDLARSEELTVRTHQLNTTGITYSAVELEELTQSKSHLLLVAELTDRFGSYGKIGLVLVEKSDDQWTIKLLIVSCRVLARGIGSILLQFLLHKAKALGVRLFAEFKPTDRNRVMHIALRFAGFKRVDDQKEVALYEHELTELSPLPPHIEVRTTLK